MNSKRLLNKEDTCNPHSDSCFSARVNNLISFKWTFSGKYFVGIFVSLSCVKQVTFYWNVG